VNSAGETWWLFAIQTTSSTGFAASYPFVAVYLLNERGASFTETGFAYLVAGVAAIFGQIVSGRLTDSYGIRRMMLIELVLSAFFSALIGFIVLERGSVILLFVAYPLLFLFNSASQLTASSIVADRQPTEMSNAFALLYIGLNLGFTIGTAVGGALATEYGYAPLFVLGALCPLAACWMTLKAIKHNVRYALRRKKTRAVKEGNIGRGRLDGDLIAFLLLTFLASITISYGAIPLAVYVSRFLNLSNLVIGFLFATNGLLVVVLQLPLSKFFAGLRRNGIALIFGSVMQSLGFFLLPAFRNFAGLEIVVILVTSGEMLIAVPAQIVIATRSELYNRGTYQGYYYAVSRAGSSVAAFLGPLSFALLFANPSEAWYLVSATAITTSIGFAVWISISQNRSE